MSTKIISLPTSAHPPLTPEKLRTFPGCEHYDDGQAIEIIETLDTLARFFLQAAARHGTHYDNQKESSKTQILPTNTALKRAA